jgi:hypothetical protein
MFLSPIFPSNIKQHPVAFASWNTDRWYSTGVFYSAAAQFCEQERLSITHGLRQPI